MKDRKRQVARRRLDARLGALPGVDKLAAPPRGWIRAIRDALGMTGPQLAARLSISPQVLAKLEQSEARGAIQMSTLRRAAQALDCALVYAFVPHRSLEETVRVRARARALQELRRSDRTMALEDQAVSDEARDDLIADYIDQHLRDRDLWDER